MRILKRLMLSVLLVMGATFSNAQEAGDVHPVLTEKYTLHAGLFFPDRNFRIHVDGSVGDLNPNIDFENEFGLNKSDQVFSVEFGWRFGEKWSLLTQYFDTSGSRTAVLDEDIEWQDVIFAEGSNATAGQEFSVIRTFFGRRFDTNERHDVGIGGGLHWFELGAFIEGEIIVAGQGNQFQRESVSADAPLPNVGAWYNYSISPKWAFTSRLDYLSADIGDYSGSLLNLGAGINYRVVDRFGNGLNYNRLELDLSLSKTDWRGGTETTYQGLFVYASGYW
jgi:hypothetical protein